MAKKPAKKPDAKPAKKAGAKEVKPAARKPDAKAAKPAAKPSAAKVTTTGSKAPTKSGPAKASPIAPTPAVKAPATVVTPVHSADKTAAPPLTSFATPGDAIDRDWVTHEWPMPADPLTHWPREWLLTNGTGAFAMGTVPGVNTRRYHGLLIASTRPPVGRIVALNQVLEQLTLNLGGQTQTLEFNACQFPGTNNGPDTFAPRGFAMLRRFAKGASVLWQYQWGTVSFTRELFLHWHEQAATLRYRVAGLNGAAGSATLKLAPMVTLRDFHALLRKDAAGNFSSDSRVDGVTVQREGGPAVTFRCDKAARFNRQRDWWFNIVYRVDTERGQDDREDYFIPGAFEVTLDPKQAEHVITLTAALGAQPAPEGSAGRARADHLKPMLAAISKNTVILAPGGSRGLPSTSKGDDSAGSGATPGFRRGLLGLLTDLDSLDIARLRKMLILAADDFVVKRTIRGKDLSTIIAGYPWFADWGRDTFIALPGLLLETGRFAEAKATLHAFAAAIKDGLVPNRFDDYDDNSAHYNTVDGSLWFVQAALRYRAATNDADSWQSWLQPAVLSIMDAYIRGTHYDIRMAGDGLITAGSPSTQLTWMDAATGGTVFTPRHGKAVEINALWYACLVGLSGVLKATDKQRSDHFDKLAARIKRSFAKTFWSDAKGCLIDHVWTDEANNEHRDESLRPNQVFAVSLADSPIPQTLQKQVLDVVRQNLLTPKGLRTLPPGDAKYHSRYRGDQYHRDEAYHQGTVWAWLIGPYVEAVLRVGRFSDESRREAMSVLRPLLEEMVNEGVGQLHEIYEADPPHRAVGCMAQAWSISEVLRALRLIEG